MNYLLDTHSFIWLAKGDRRLSKAVVELAADPDSNVYLSVISRWEIGLKQRTDAYLLPRPFDVIFSASGFQSLDLAFDVPKYLSGLPYHHKDPFDRLIVAHALATEMTLVSRDENVNKYDVPLFW